jgi:hypothetical protein
MLRCLLPILLAAAILSLATPAHALQPVVVREAGLEVALWDQGDAPRAEPVARWLAGALGPLLPAGFTGRLEVERRSMDRLYAVEAGRLLLHPRLPSSSVDEQLQVLALASWILLSSSEESPEAWARALAVVEPLRPGGWSPRWWPRCCRGLDAMEPPWAPVSPSVEPADPSAWRFAEPAPEPSRAFGRADLYGGFRLPLASDWPWVVGTFALYAPVDRGEFVLGLEAMPLGLVEIRGGAGYAQLRRGVLRLDAGPLLAWNPGSVMSPSQRQPGLGYAAQLQPGLWVDGELGGFQGLLRVLPDEDLGVDGWVGWERRVQLSERWYLQPFGRARLVSDNQPERILSMGGSAGVRWMDVDGYLTHRTAAVRMEAEHVIPTGRLLGPSWLRPRAVLLRAGADCGYAPEYGFVGGWAGSLGLALHPVREVKGVGWLTVAAPTDMSSLVWIVWLSTWIPQP